MTTLVDSKKFHLENECGVRADFIAKACFSVGEVMRDNDLPLVAHMHVLKCFRPAWDNSVEWEHLRLASFITAIKDFTVDKASTVVN